jgi:hypothetical protein
MHKRATNALLATVTGSALAGMMIAGVVHASTEDHATGSPAAAQRTAHEKHMAHVAQNSKAARRGR